MNKIGLIGGMGPESTVEYYQGIIDKFKAESDDLNYPDIIIYSVNLSRFIGLVNSGDERGAVDYLSEKLKKVEKAGPDFIALTANTPHLFFDELQSRVDVPMLSIVDATASEARRLKLKNCGLLGTGITMNNSFFSDVFKKSGMEITVPGETQRKYLNTKLFSEIELGIFKNETRDGILQIIDEMKQTNGIDGVIMGCTELPLILPDDEYYGIPVLNTTKIHINEIVRCCREASDIV